MSRNFKPEREREPEPEPERGSGHGRDRFEYGSREGRSHDIPERGLARCVVPVLTPVRTGGRGRSRMGRLLRGRRRATAAGLAVAAAAMAASAPRGDHDGSPRAVPGHDAAAASATGVPKGHPGPGDRPPGTGATVSAPVRIADAATVRLLRPGDRVDVIAGADGSGPARVIAKGARVDRVPESVETDPVDGALIVLRVPRGTATALAGAAVGGPLAVTLC